MKMEICQKCHKEFKKLNLHLLQSHDNVSWRKGKKDSLEQRKAKSSKLLGHPVKNSTREKLRAAHIGKQYALGKGYTHKGQKAWNKGLTKETDVRVRKIAESSTGIKRTVATREKLKKIHTGKKLSEEHKKKIGQKSLGHIVSEEGKRRIGEKNSIAMKANWKNIDYAINQSEKIYQALSNKPNKFELKVTKIIQKYFPNIKYVGNGTFWIEGCNPDFLEKEYNIIIEANGCWFHKCSLCYPTLVNDNSFVNRICIFEKFGYKVLVIWEHEFTKFSTMELEQKISNFKSNIVTLETT